MTSSELQKRFQAGQRHFFGVDLQGGDLSQADLHGTVLHGADLRSAHFHGANLQEADLAEADLHGAVMEEDEGDQLVAMGGSSIAVNDGTVFN
jgi:uncharacterized protein YjbI with pentapeptide repeats